MKTVGRGHFPNPAGWCVRTALSLLLPLAATCEGAALTLTTLNGFYGTNGAQPVASLLLGADGNVYGTTSAGGLNGDGTVFRATLSGAITTMASFDNTNTGAKPFGQLVRGTDGNFYGTTSTGGTYGNGTVFTMTPAGSLTTLASFAGTNGAQPRAGLLPGTNGTFYGTTYGGGAYDLGTVFMLATNGSLTTLVSFNGTNGARPIAGLTSGASGRMYGAASAGGPFNSGAIFRLSLLTSLTISTNSSGNPTNRVTITTTNTVTSAVLTNLYFFTGTGDGAAPQAALLLASDGTFYGTTAGGGTNNVASGGSGTVFNITSSGALSNLFSFARTNGSSPAAPLVQGTDGSFYGTTRAGGTYGAGIIFSLTPAGILTLLHSFTLGSDGSDPYYSGLIQGPDGNLYGLTSARGPGGSGTLYQVAGFAPFIIAAPASQTVPVGTTVTLDVSAGGSPPLSYRWQRDSVNLRDGYNLSGATTATLTISNATTANSGTYSVIVQNSAGAVTNTGTVLTVLDRYGTNGPALSIVTPKPGAVLKTAVLTVRGTTSSAVPVAEVYFHLNDGDWQLASAQGSWANWAAKVILPPGPNVIQAYAVSIVGTSSPTNTVSFVCGITSAPVVVQINGSGTVSPNYNSQWLEIGRTYTMLARPRSGYLFSNWVQSVSSNPPLFISSPWLTFSTQSNLLLQASFVPSPFAPLKGAYNGLFYDTNGVTPESAGFLTVSLTAKGAFSGRVQLGAARYSVSGQFDLNGAAQVTTRRSRFEPLHLTLQLDLAGGTEQITGLITSGTWTSVLDAGRTVFNGRTSLAAQAGRYTLVVPGTGSTGEQPGGDSYGVLTVNTAGRIRLTASLADGTKLTQAASLWRNGQWPLYAPLYRGAGLWLGPLVLSSSSGTNLSGEVIWIKPPLPETPYYPVGFAVQVEVLGSRYSPPAGTANPLPFTSAEAVLSGAALAQNITNRLTLNAHNRVTVLSGPGLTLAFAPATGLFKGSAVNPSAAKPVSFGGVVLQNWNLGRGYFLGSPQSGQSFLGPDESIP